MKVNIAVHGRWHAFELTNGLHRRGAMGRLVTTYPAFVARRFVDPDIELRTRPLLEVRRRLYDRWQLGHKPDLAIARAFGAFAARSAVGGADLLVGWSSAALEAIPPARAAGMKVVIERGSTHIRHQVRILTEAYSALGLNYAETDPEIVHREIAEYEAADAIAVPTGYAMRTFVAEGIAPEKLIVNPYGVDLSRFVPSTDRATGRRLRIVFVGRVGIQKGVPWLLDAVAELDRDAELHLIGPVEQEMASILDARRGERVVVRGALPSGRLPEEYAAADIMCLPSLQEGLPLTLLQAMACGLPAVVTEAAAGDLLGAGEQGLIVPPRDAHAIRSALHRLIDDADLPREMGISARRTIGAGHGWQDYADRALAAYQHLLD